MMSPALVSLDSVVIRKKLFSKAHFILNKSPESMLTISSNYISQANKWCAKGVELLASQRIEKCSVSAEHAEQSLQEIQQFITSANDFCVSSPREFRNVFQDSTTPETKALVTQVSRVLLLCFSKDYKNVDE